MNKPANAVCRVGVSDILLPRRRAVANEAAGAIGGKGLTGIFKLHIGGTKGQVRANSVTRDCCNGTFKGSIKVAKGKQGTLTVIRKRRVDALIIGWTCANWSNGLTESIGIIGGRRRLKFGDVANRKIGAFSICGSGWGDCFIIIRGITRKDTCNGSG